jgi:hypothetical protein
MIYIRVYSLEARSKELGIRVWSLELRALGFAV